MDLLKRESRLGSGRLRVNDALRDPRPPV